MKRFLSLLALVLLLSSGLFAQSNGGGHHGSGGSGSGSGHHGSQANNSPWAGMNLPNAWRNWLENGGNMPGSLRDAVIDKAAPWGMQTFGLTVNQMKQRYNQGTLTIVYVLTAPPTLSFRVGFGGVGTVVIIDLP